MSPISRIKRIKNNSGGFTLIELLVVIAIIGVLTTIGIGNFRTARIKARDARRKQDLSTISKALEAFYNDHRAYPRASDDGELICIQVPETVCDWGTPFKDANTTYITKLPSETRSGVNYLYASNNGADWALYAVIENDNDPSIDNTIVGVDCGSEPCNYKISSSNATSP